jgi:hypothetical protein
MMRVSIAKRIFGGFIALSLAGCSTFGDPGFTPSSGVQSVQTKAGQALAIAWRSFDLILSLVDAAQAAGKLKKDSPEAIRVHDTLARALAALNAATDALRAGQAENFTSALTLAEAALREASAVVGPHS